MNFIKSRKPTLKELEDLRLHELWMGEKEELDEALKLAQIAVFDTSIGDSQGKTMLVFWGDRSSYIVYTWRNGEIQTVGQNKGIQEYIENLY
jgi:hypothetical protein